MRRLVSLTLALLFVLLMISTAGAEESRTKPLTQNITLHAKKLKTCTVTFSLNKGSGTCPAKQVLTKGSLATRPANPPLTNGVFEGWYRDKACKKPWDFSTRKVTKNTTIYAKVKQVVVTFKLNGGKGKSPAKQRIAPGALVTRPSNPSRKGYSFTGWYTDKKGKSAWAFTSGRPANNLKLYACWKKNASTGSSNGKTCTWCGGKGSVYCTNCTGSGSVKCGTCLGFGYYWTGVGNNRTRVSCPSSYACPKCKSGRVTCSICFGTGKR